MALQDGSLNFKRGSASRNRARLASRDKVASRPFTSTLSEALALAAILRAFRPLEEVAMKKRSILEEIPDRSQVDGPICVLGPEASDGVLAAILAELGQVFESAFSTLSIASSVSCLLAISSARCRFTNGDFALYAICLRIRIRSWPSSGVVLCLSMLFCSSQ
jgi:hypothetical protein